MNSVFKIDAHQEPHREETRHDGRAPVAHEGQSEPLRRKRPRGDADVDEDLHAEPNADSLCEQAREIPFQLDGLPPDFKGVANQPVKKKKDDEDAGETGFLGPYRHNKVGVGFGEVSKFSTDPPSPTPKSSPRPKAMSECES